MAKPFSPIFDDFKILAEVPHPLVKFDEKSDCEVAESIQPTVLEYKFSVKMELRGRKN